MSENWILATLSGRDLDLLRPHLQDVALAQETVLIEGNQNEEHIYFPYRGTASLVAQTAGGSTIEIATIGRDGVIGCLAALGLQRAFARAVVNVELGALRIPTSRIVELLPKSEALGSSLVAEAERLMFQVQQLSGCNALHPIEERVARLLLRTADCIGSNIVPLTQELMSQMLGVQRTTVNLVIRMMASVGAVRTRRGHVEIIDRPTLESRTCECYASIRDRLGRDERLGLDRAAAPILDRVAGE
jgi:CRP-like cAMP-binding protein